MNFSRVRQLWSWVECQKKKNGMDFSNRLRNIFKMSSTANKLPRLIVP